MIFAKGESAEEQRLVYVAQRAVRRVFQHVRHKIIELGDHAYLPKAKQEPGAYFHLNWLRRKQAVAKLSAGDYELLARLPHILGRAAERIYGKVEQCDGGWRWTFVPVGLQVFGNVHESYVAAVEQLRQLQHALYPAWHDPAKRAAHLQYLLRSQPLKQELHDIVSRRRLAFARDRLSELTSCSGGSGSIAVALACGLPNLGNTCYINAVTQCLFHCMPFREDIESQAQGASFMGDRLQALLNIYKNENSTQLDVVPRVAEWVEQVLNQANFTGGSQQDAAECLMHILMSVDGGSMQRRVCGANAVAAVENMLLCQVDVDAQVSHNAAPVDMSAMLARSLVGDQAIAQAAPALVLRIENIYEAGGEYFSVDAAADWSGNVIEVTVRDAPERHPRYAVAGYVAHVSDANVDARRRMCTGHYVAYVQSAGSWYELDDGEIRALSHAPTRFPYLVFLDRQDAPRRCRGKQANRKARRQQMHALLKARAALCQAAVAGESVGKGSR